MKSVASSLRYNSIFQNSRNKLNYGRVFADNRHVKSLTNNGSFEAASLNFRTRYSSTNPFSSKSTNEESRIPRKTENYFAILKLGENPKFTIDDHELKKTYKRLMTDLHPDRVVNRSDGMTANDLHELASEVTQAYDVVSKPHSRAMHLLDLLGVPINENDSGDVVGHEFLMKVMIAREQVDDASTDSERYKLLEDNDKRVKACCEALDHSIQDNNYADAKRLAAELQYWNRVENTIKENMSSVR